MHTIGYALARSAVLAQGGGGGGQPDFEVTGIDLGVIVTYIVVTIVIGYLYSRRSGNEDSEGYFLGGRQFLWPLIGFSLLATNMSGSSFVGFASSGYNQGVGVYNYEWVAAIVLVFFAIFVLPFYLRSRVFTMPEFLERRYDRRSRYAFAGFTILANLFIDAAGALYAGGIVVQTIYPDIPLWQIIAGLAFVAAIYTVLGGLSAVVITDTIQAIFLMIGGAIILVAAYNAVDMDQVRQSAPDGAFSIIQPLSDDAMPWLGLVSGVVLIGFYYWVCNQVVVQRVLGAKDVNHGRWGLLFAGVLKLPNIALFILPGVFATALYPNLESADLAFPTLVFDLLPVGIRGIVLAALLAAIMSSLDSTLNSVSTIVTVDFFQTRNSELSQRRQVWIGRVSTVVFAVIATAWAPQITRFPTIFSYLQSYLSYTVIPVVVVFLGAIFYRKASAQAGFWTIAVGVPLGLIGWALNEVVFQEGGLQFLIIGGLLFFVWSAFYWAVSRATYAEDDAVDEDLVWTWQTWREESRELADVPWWQNYRYLAVGLLVLTVAVVLPFTGLVGIPGIPA